ncbi:hypothetical protein D1AOALGA4SA_5602 [Olavius algarvensis Delta 1 endosymbiont]|nr:hypothetical protein D1AOALGA4SA_5602 [Olavius algarvensis Delta 1 endosymbiont]
MKSIRDKGLILVGWFEANEIYHWHFMWISQGKPTAAGHFRFVQQILTF